MPPQSESLGEIVRSGLTIARQELPPQNPLWNFVHNNLLLGFEKEDFKSALRRASVLYGAKCLESEVFYQRALSSGRISKTVLTQLLEPYQVSLSDFVEGRLPAQTHFDAIPTWGPVLQSQGVAYYRALEDTLVPLISSYLDQGMAAWGNPYAAVGFWKFFVDDCLRMPRWHTPYAAELKQRVASHQDRSPLTVLEHELRWISEFPPVSPIQLPDYLVALCFELKGWSGMVARLESEPSLAPIHLPKLDFSEWAAALAVTAHALVSHFASRSAVDLRVPANVPYDQTVTFERRWIWQQGYETSFVRAFVSEITQRPDKGLKVDQQTAKPPAPYQALLCIDDREESMRRAIEQLQLVDDQGLGIETFSTPGSFGFEVSYQGLRAARATQQCPPVVAPRFTVNEVPRSSVLAPDQSKSRRLQGSVALSLYYGSRSLVGGSVLSLALGLTSFVPLIVKVLRPSRFTAWRQRLTRWFAPDVATRIELGAIPHSEQVNIVRATLTAAGLSRFGSVVVVIGHGATSTNNPFRQAYGCGACSGNSGAANARMFVQLANRENIRSDLSASGIGIPANTLFVAAHHDTTLDTVTLLDAEDVPTDRQHEVHELFKALRKAAVRNADERCLRLEGAPASGQKNRHAHVQDRAFDLAEPRPEYGHARVAACVVGKRSMTAHLNLDRRAFLVSYDAAQDPDGTHLKAATSASVPVAVNIGMDYFYSRIDPERFGAGSKLPLNIVSLLGVLTGAKGDLRTGLGRQMIELHEPMRMTVFVQAYARHLEPLTAEDSRFARLVKGRWLWLLRQDPDTGQVEVWNDRFVPLDQMIASASVDRALFFDCAHDTVIGSTVIGSTVIGSTVIGS